MAKLTVLVAALGMPVLGAAHDLWIERTPGALALRHGHRGEKLLAIDAAKVKWIRCVSGPGAPRDVVRTASFSPKEVRFSASCSVASAFKDGGHWSLTPDGEVNLPRSQVEEVVRSWASRQFAKWVDGRSPRAGTVLGDELELVPVTDLAKARPGDEVTLRVLSAGRPVPDARVVAHHRPVGETDSKGEIRLRLRTPGVESVSTSVRRPPVTPEVDAEVLEASLTFEVTR